MFFWPLNPEVLMFSWPDVHWVRVPSTVNGKVYMSKCSFNPRQTNKQTNKRTNRQTDKRIFFSYDPPYSRGNNRCPRELQHIRRDQKAPWAAVTEIGHDECAVLFCVLDYLILAYFYVILKSRKFWTKKNQREVFFHFH